MRTILHIDFNSYFATVEQQANSRLRGKPVGVTGPPATQASLLALRAGGDRMERTVIGAASVEAKKFGVKTGMQIWQAKQLCPDIILVPGDSDKYLETTKRFLNIIKDYSPYVEVFSIDECFLEIPSAVIPVNTGIQLTNQSQDNTQHPLKFPPNDYLLDPALRRDDSVIDIAQDIKSRIRFEIGEWITCSIGISYNKLMAKLAGSMYKPDGLVVVADEEAAMWILDRVELDEICGIGGRIKKRLNNMGVFNFATLRKVPLEALLASFKSYGQILYNIARGIDNAPIIPFYEKEEVKSIGHRHTIDHDTDNPEEIKQILLKLTELIARRLRAKKLVGKTVSCWYRNSLELGVRNVELGIWSYELGKDNKNPNSFNLVPSSTFQGDGKHITISYTSDGWEIFKTSWKIFNEIWENPSTGSGFKIRMIGVSISNLKPQTPQNLSLLEEVKSKEIIIQTLDKINDKYGEFTLQRGILLGSASIKRKPNPFLADRRFKF